MGSINQCTLGQNKCKSFTGPCYIKLCPAQSQGLVCRPKQPHESYLHQREYTRSGHQSQKGKENTQRVSHCGQRAQAPSAHPGITITCIAIVFDYK